jgi:hypothetical protein
MDLGAGSQFGFLNGSFLRVGSDSAKIGVFDAKPFCSPQDGSHVKTGTDVIEENSEIRRLPVDLLSVLVSTHCMTVVENGISQTSRATESRIPILNQGIS